MIILGKYKDYYDYLVGVYGRDENVVFDRKEVVILNNNTDDFHNPLWYKEKFTKEKSSSPDTRKSASKMYKWSIKNPYIDLSQPHGKLYYVGIEIGFKLYKFMVERYLDEADNLCIEPKLLEVTEISNKMGKSPISLIPYYDRCYGIYGFQLRPDINAIKENPIMCDTWIPKFIPADEIYNNICDYLIASKDKKIIDTRTDVQKAQSHGFNKESFRNPIKLKDLK